MENIYEFLDEETFLKVVDQYNVSPTRLNMMYGIRYINLLYSTDEIPVESDMRILFKAMELADEIGILEQEKVVHCLVLRDGESFEIPQ